MERTRRAVRRTRVAAVPARRAGRPAALHRRGRRAVPRRDGRRGGGRRDPPRARPGGPRDGGRGAGRSPAPRRGARPGRRSRGWRDCAPTRGPRRSTCRWARGGCAPAGGFTGRANAALAIGDPGLPTAAGAGRGTRVRRRARDPGAGAGADGLAVGPGGGGGRAGCSTSDHEAGPEVAVLVARPAAARGARPMPSSWHPEPSDPWWRAGRRPGTDPGAARRARPGHRPAHRVRAARPDGDRRSVRARARRGPPPPVPAASACPARAPARSRPHAHGRGRRVGLDQGARWAVLQVRAAQRRRPGRSTTRLGCVEHHRYRYLVAAVSAARGGEPALRLRGPPASGPTTRPRYFPTTPTTGSRANASW